jgi:5-methylcytosine-specific restriction protein A
MPHAALRYCTTPGCPNKTRGGPCDQHRPSTAKGWGTTGTDRVRGRTLQRLRVLLFQAEPLCRICAAKGFTRVATIRDHIIPLAEGGTDAEKNVQPLCTECSDQKTRQEARRGMRREH